MFKMSKKMQNLIWKSQFRIIRDHFEATCSADYLKGFLSNEDLFVGASNDKFELMAFSRLVDKHFFLILLHRWDLLASWFKRGIKHPSS